MKYTKSSQLRALSKKLLQNLLAECFFLILIKRGRFEKSHEFMSLLNRIPYPWNLNNIQIETKRKQNN